MPYLRRVDRKSRFWTRHSPFTSPGEKEMVATHGQGRDDSHFSVINTLAAPRDEYFHPRDTRPVPPNARPETFKIFFRLVFLELDKTSFLASTGDKMSADFPER